MATFPRKPKISSTSLAANTFPRLAVTVKKEGYLIKRGRGRSPSDYKSLRFQIRYCVLSPTELAYYDDKKKIEQGQKPNGDYLVKDIQIVEKVPMDTFGKRYCFQVGNKNEVMYFFATSEESQRTWINAFIEVAFTLRSNERLPLYHSGAFGLNKKNCWSCCKEEDKKADGCQSRICSITVSEHKENKFPMGSETNTESKSESNHHKTRCYSVESGLGQSPANSRRGTTISQSDEQELSIPKARTSSYYRDSGVPTAIAELAELEIEAQPKNDVEPSERLIYTSKNVMQADGDFSYATSVMFKGSDCVIAATDTGMVFASSLNETKKVLFDADRKEGVAISARGKYMAIASTNIKMLDLDNNKETQLGSNQASCQLVAFSPDGFLFTADRKGNCVSMWSKSDDWMEVNIASRPVSTFKLADDGDSVFSMTVSPHPKHPLLAVVITHPANGDHCEYSVHICNYVNKHSTHWTSKTIGPHISVAFTHDGQHLYIGQGVTITCLNLNDWKTKKVTVDKACHITSLASSPVRHQFAVGLSTGKVKYFTGIPSETAVYYETMGKEAVTSLAYSRDGLKVAIAYKDGKVEVSKGSKPPKEPVIVRKRALTVTSEEQSYYSDEDGYTITIPEGSVKEGTQVILHHGVAPHSPYGPFEFEAGTRLVSTILQLCPEPEHYKFLKPIKITLPHFIACETQEDCNKLFFSKAQHHNFRVSNNQKIYKFEKVRDGILIPSSVCQNEQICQTIDFNAATLCTEHCCYICMQQTQNISEEDTRNACYSLHQIVPLHRSGLNYEVYYCLSYQLPTCRQAVDEQFPNTDYVKRRKAIQFEHQGQEGELEIHISTQSLPENWNLRLVGKEKIAKTEIWFWDYNPGILEELCEERQYPPRITLRVTCGDFVREGLIVPISFTGISARDRGVSEDFFLELTKPQIEYPSPDLAENATLRETLQDRLYKDANNVNCERLALALYSRSTPQRCPYLTGNTSAVAFAREKINSFLSIARQRCESNYSANFSILSDALDIAETVDKKYAAVIQDALAESLADTEKDRLQVPRNGRDIADDM